MRIPASGSTFLIATQPLFYVTLLTYLLAFINWMVLLGKADLSYAAPLASLSYLTVTISSVLVLHEHVTAGRMYGILLILAGAALIGSTPSQSRDRESAMSKETNP